MGNFPWILIVLAIFVIAHSLTMVVPILNQNGNGSPEIYYKYCSIPSDCPKMSCSEMDEPDVTTSCHRIQKTCFCLRKGRIISPTGKNCSSSLGRCRSDCESIRTTSAQKFEEGTICQSSMINANNMTNVRHTCWCSYREI